MPFEYPDSIYSNGLDEWMDRYVKHKKTEMNDMENMRTPEEEHLEKTTRFLRVPEGDTYITFLDEGKQAYLDSEGRESAIETVRSVRIYRVNAFSVADHVKTLDKMFQAPRSAILVIAKIKKSNGTNVGCWIRLTRQGLGINDTKYTTVEVGAQDVPSWVRG